MLILDAIKTCTINNLKDKNNGLSIFQFNIADYKDPMNTSLKRLCYIHFQKTKRCFNAVHCKRPACLLGIFGRFVYDYFNFQYSLEQLLAMRVYVSR